MLHQNDNLSTPEHSPASIAVRKLSKLSSDGASANRLIAAAAEFVTGWQKAGANAEALREGITAVLSEVDDGAVAAEQFADEAETDLQRAAARMQADALRSLQEALATMVERLG